MLVLNVAAKSDLVSASTQHIITANKDLLSFYKKPNNVEAYLGHTRKHVKTLEMFSLSAYALTTF